MDAEKRFKIKQFLKGNLDVLQGEALAEFMEKYDIAEVNSVQMMLLDHSGVGDFIAMGNPHKPGHYFFATEDTLEKILLLAPLDPETENILEGN
jgi:hypothetical protein